MEWELQTAPSKQISAGKRPFSIRLLADLTFIIAMSAAATWVSRSLAVEPPQFGPTTNFPAGTYPQAIVSADFNRDGRPDIVVATGDGLCFLPGQAGGALGPRTLYPSIPGSIAALSTGDFNRDGNLDILEADWYSTRIILGDGAGNFSVLTNMSGDHSFSAYPTAVAVGDLNGDGNADIAIANTLNPNQRGIALGFGRGDGFFGAPTNCPLPTTAGDIALGDLNGDGWLDAAVSLHSYSSGLNSLGVLTNRGDGTLGPAQYYNATNQDLHYSLALVDFDTIHGLDIAILNYNAGSVTIRLNNGNGLFNSASDYPMGFLPVSLTVNDFNGDEKVDLFIRGHQTLARMLLGNGDGSFTLGPPMTVFPGTQSGGTVTADDFNGNGTPDLAFSSTAPHAVAIMLNETPPIVQITPGAGGNEISWLATFGTGFGLEYTTNFHPTAVWEPFPGSPVPVGKRNKVTDTIELPHKFYRLKKL